MGLVRAFKDSIGSTFADQWKEIITAGEFDEYSVVVPGILKQSNNGRGTNTKGSDGVISNGSKIFIPENTAAFIFSQSGIEEVITTPGGYEYQNGEDSIFNGDNFKRTIIDQATERFGYGGQTSSEKRIAFVNLREIRDIKFGTQGPLMYNDFYYGTDLEILAFGSFSLIVTDPEKLIRNFVPANMTYYSFNDKGARKNILSEFLQSFMVSLNSLSTQYRISELPSQSNEIALKIANDSQNAGTWEERFGFKLVKIGIHNIEFSPESRQLVKQYSSNKMNIKAFDEVSQKTSNIAAQQKIAKGIQDNGFGEGGNMIYGMNMAQALGTKAEVKSESNPLLSFDEQIEMLTKLKGLLDAGILTQEEFDLKKKQIMNL